MIAQIIDVFISGITIGSIYALMAVGMALVYGVTKVFNFAYGSFYGMGGYIAYTLFTRDCNYAVVFVVTIPALFLSGMIIERLLIRKIRERASWEIDAMMVTLGLAMFLDQLYFLIFGPTVKSLPTLFKGSVNIFNYNYSYQDISMFIIAIGTIWVLLQFLNKTRSGRAVRAVALDIEGARIVGIPVNQIFGLSFAISSVMVGVSGILLAPKYFVSPLGGWDILVKAWVITAFGGMGSLRGSLYAAYILGIVEAFVGWQFGFTWTLLVWFIILLGTLIIRPQGLLGKWG